MPVTAKIAQRMIAAAEKKAEEIGVPMVIAVVDQGGNLVAQLRQDDALLVSIDLSRNKAYTAVAVKMTTAILGSVSQPGGELYGIHAADGGRIVIFGGGLPIEEGGKVVGAIGVSGGSVEQDTACAEAGLAAYTE
ncbi:heme-binding protein [Maridesulfovibrio sp.]|uniref:GlcG/HbpS family heme-binding protein n=1 Tax=Maridesulfovibrio sp. TaxID=2795000 RepID=UPI002A18835A|nr:heme-binding protein [Maridesulfovibrio sp.]